MKGPNHGAGELIKLLNDVLGSLTSERMAALEACTSVVDVLKFMADLGLELSDELLDIVA